MEDDELENLGEDFWNNVDENCGQPIETPSSSPKLTNPPGRPLTSTQEPAKCMSDSVSLNSAISYVEDDDAAAVPPSFVFPFKPYSIQVAFMKRLFYVLETGRIGIFESPTGTGKSLSLLCGTMTWYHDWQKRHRQQLEETVDACNRVLAEDDDDWLGIGHERKKENQAKKDSAKTELEYLENREILVDGYREACKRSRIASDLGSHLVDKSLDRKKRAAANQDTMADKHFDSDSDEDLVPDYRSDGEAATTDNISRFTLDPDIDDSSSSVLKGDSGAESDKPSRVRIYYCSRTHSQLAQFLKELKRTEFAPYVSCVTLGSRQTFCINGAVRKLGALSLINDRCLEMQKKGKSIRSVENQTARSKRGCKCPFYRSVAIQSLSESLLGEVQDVEDLLVTAKKAKICPYYASRFASPMADLILLPYNSLFHKATREACGIDLRDAIVIVDEAHNLVDTIRSIHSVRITQSQVERALSQVEQYIQRYKERLKAKNLYYIRQVLEVLQKLRKSWVLPKPVQRSAVASSDAANLATERAFGLTDFLYHSHLDNVNLFKLLRYMDVSQVSRKLSGFVQRSVASGVKPTEADTPWPIASNAAGRSSGLQSFLGQLSSGNYESCPGQDEPQSSKSTGEHLSEVKSYLSPLVYVQSFIECLVTATANDRIIVNVEKASHNGFSSIRYVPLSPASFFQPIVSEARAVVLAGGTMKPDDELKDHLFASCGVSPDRIDSFSCDHVVPSHHLFPVILNSAATAAASPGGPSPIQLEFSFERRRDERMLDALGDVLVKIASKVPGGVICFFASYEIELTMYQRWSSSGILDKLERMKKLFREPKSSSDVDDVLNGYSDIIKRAVNKSTTYTGSILFAVVGGKLSEGINFSDDLGRAVIMIGMPYPNIKSVELQEKMRYLDRNMKRIPGKPSPGQLFYENSCMKAVNQSIGRAIRHKDDYAAILLIDGRYGRQSIINKLPSWIGSQLRTYDNEDSLCENMEGFFTGFR